MTRILITADNAANYPWLWNFLEQERLSGKNTWQANQEYHYNNQSFSFQDLIFVRQRKADRGFAYEMESANKLGDGLQSEVYYIKRTISNGKTGKFQVTDKKRIVKKFHIPAVAWDEYTIAQTMEHLHVKPPSNNRLVMKEMMGLTLEKFLKQYVNTYQLSQHEILVLTKALLKDYNHQINKKELVHDDLHSGNVFIEYFSGQENPFLFKIIDFGMAKYLNPQQTIDFDWEIGEIIKEIWQQQPNQAQIFAHLEVLKEKKSPFEDYLSLFDKLVLLPREAQYELHLGFELLRPSKVAFILKGVSTELKQQLLDSISNPQLFAEKVSECKNLIDALGINQPNFNPADPVLITPENAKHHRWLWYFLEEQRQEGIDSWEIDKEYTHKGMIFQFSQPLFTRKRKNERGYAYEMQSSEKTGLESETSMYRISCTISNGKTGKFQVTDKNRVVKNQDEERNQHEFAAAQHAPYLGVKEPAKRRLVMKKKVLPTLGLKQGLDLLNKTILAPSTETQILIDKPLKFINELNKPLLAEQLKRILIEGLDQSREKNIDPLKKALLECKTLLDEQALDATHSFLPVFDLDPQKQKIVNDIFSYFQQLENKSTNLIKNNNVVAGRKLGQLTADLKAKTLTAIYQPAAQQKNALLQCGKECQQLLTENQKLLNTHQNSNYIWAEIGIILASLVVLYPLAAGVHYLRTGQVGFFSQTKTLAKAPEVTANFNLLQAI